MRSIVVLALVLLLGCAPDPAADNYGYGWAYDAEGETGLRLRVDVANPLDRSTLEPIEATLATLEAAWLDTITCTGLPAHPGPLVVIVESGELGPNRGYTYYDTRLVLLAMNWGGLWLVETARHEFVHLLLADHGFPDGRNTAHDSPLFDACA